MGWAGDLLKKGAGALAGNFGSILGGAVDFLGASSANRQNKKQAQKQMDFQERLSNTEIQRRTADLLAAGMNPMLAYGQGGASSASGASAQIESPTKNAVNTAMGIRAQRAQLEQMSAQTKLLTEQARGQYIQNSLNENEIPWSAANAENKARQALGGVDKLAEEIANLKINRSVSEEDLRTKKLTNDQLEKLQPIILQIQEIERQAKKLGLSQQKVDAQFADAFGTENKWIQLLLQLIRNRK